MEDFQIHDDSLLAEMEDILNETNLSVSPFAKQTDNIVTLLKTLML